MTQLKVPLRHYLQFSDLSSEEYAYILNRSAILKEKFKAYETWHPLHDRTLAMIFEKHSTRTRLSFEAGMFQLGGHAVYLNTRDTQLGRGEPVEDAAQVISRMTDIIMIRTFGQEILERFANNSRVPVINGLTNEFHPCQVLADIFTFHELRGDISGKVVTWVGDANNMAYTWLQAAQILNFEFHFSGPAGYPLDMSRISTEEKEHLKIFADGPQSVVWQEAENRLHVQKALMEFLLCGKFN